MAKKATEKVPRQMEKIYQELTRITDDFSAKYLNKEYAALCRKAAAALCRKRPSPLSGGSLKIWAFGIIHALGTVNFLFDKANKPYLSTGELYKIFDVAKSTGAAKGKKVRDLLKMNFYNYEWFLQRRIDESPMVWMISVNGYIVDARSLPLEIQEAAFEKGLIPYIPADRERGSN